jgi:hypothetical protein
MELILWLVLAIVVLALLTAALVTMRRRSRSGGVIASPRSRAPQQESGR